MEFRQRKKERAIRAEFSDQKITLGLSRAGTRLWEFTKLKSRNFRSSANHKFTGISTALMFVRPIVNVGVTARQIGVACAVFEGFTAITITWVKKLI